MKLLTAKVADGRLDLPQGSLGGAAAVAVLIPEDEGAFELSDEQAEELKQALAEADRAEGIDGWKLLAELRRG